MPNANPVDNLWTIQPYARGRPACACARARARGGENVFSLSSTVVEESSWTTPLGARGSRHYQLRVAEFGKDFCESDARREVNVDG